MTRLRLVPVALAVSAVLLAAGCGEPAAPAVPPADGGSSPAAGATPAEDPTAGPAESGTEDASGVGRVVLDTGSSTVTVRGSDGPGYPVRRTVRGTDATPADSSRRDGDALVLHGCDLPDCWFDYDVTVPRGASLTGTTGSGGVDVSGLSEVTLETGSGAVAAGTIGGPVTVRSGSGAVRLTDVTGDVRLQTTSGAVQGTGLRGTRTDVATTSGAVELTTATVQSVTVGSTSGAVRLAVAPGRYRVRASGPADVEVPDDPTAAATLDVGSRSGGVAVGIAG